MTEYHDGKPVTRHEAWFRKKSFEVDDTSARLFEEGQVVPWLVVGVSRDSSYARRRDDPDAKTRTCVIEIDTVVALSGRLRDQAIDFAGLGGELGAQLHASPSDTELDRLADYLHSRWGLDASGPPAVDLAIALLERYEPALAGLPDDITGLEHAALDDDHDSAGPANDDDLLATGTDDFGSGAEVIGSIYRSTKTRDLLERAFND